MTWTHSICERCWIRRGVGVPPLATRHRELETCCFCGNKHESGIYVREDPKSAKLKGCEGEHAED